MAVRKSLSYAPLAKFERARFMPFVVEPYGAMDMGCHHIFSWLSSEAVKSRCVTSEAAFRRLAVTAMSVAIQRANSVAAHDATRYLHAGN